MIFIFFSLVMGHLLHMETYSIKYNSVVFTVFAAVYPL